jgi:hypothetical protein
MNRNTEDLSKIEVDPSVRCRRITRSPFEVWPRFHLSDGTSVLAPRLTKEAKARFFRDVHPQAKARE